MGAALPLLLRPRSPGSHARDCQDQSRIGYAATKLAQEDLVRIAANALGIPFLIFRLQNVYGEGQSLNNPYTGILSIFSNRIRQGKASRCSRMARKAVTLCMFRTSPRRWRSASSRTAGMA